MNSGKILQFFQHRNDNFSKIAASKFRTQQESFSNRNSQLNTEFQEYKIQSGQAKILIRNKIDEREKEITKDAEERQNALREKIQGLETNLGTVRNEVEGAKMRAASITIQRDELKKTLTEMKQRYNIVVLCTHHYIAKSLHKPCTSGFHSLDSFCKIYNSR